MSEETSQSVETPTESEATTETSEGQEVSTTSYLDGKYDSVSSLENGYKELQSSYSKKTAEFKEKLGAFSGAPEAYELGEGVEVSESILNFAKENQFSNEALQGLIETHTADQVAQQEAYVAEQKELLGADADARLQNVADWGRANLGEEAMATLTDMISSAAGVEIFEKIAKLSSGTSAAAVATPKVVVDRDTVREMRYATDQYGNRKMSSDPQYRAKVEAMEAELISSGGNIR